MKPGGISPRQGRWGHSLCQERRKPIKEEFDVVVLTLESLK